MTDPLAPFVGLWHLRRDIFDLDSQWTGRLTGQATFTRTPDGLVLDERGLLKFAGLTAMEATRRYLWRAEGGRIAVLFEDGRPFHRIDPSKEVSEDTHICDPDLYEVRYLFDLPTTWRAEWRVTGPRKDYRMVSTHSR